MVANAESEPLQVAVENLGGIDSRELTFEPGVTVLTGRNATNRTSLLQAITAGLGGSYGELKSDADAGEVELAVGEKTYDRQFRRDGDGVVVSGDPYADDASLVDLFSSLLEVNPARRAVERGDGDALREIIMEPVDTEAITAEVESTQRNLREVEDRLDEIERRRSNLAALKERRVAAEDDLADVESELADVREAVAEFEADAETAEEAEAVVEELTETREEYESIRNQLETQRSAVESLETEREETRERLDDLSVPEAELEATREELERLQRRRRGLENTVNDLVSIVEFNERLVDDGADALPGVGEDGAGADGDGVGASGGVADELDPSSGQIECWTCGTTVDRGDVEERLDGLRGVVEDHRSERNELRKRIDETRATLSDLQDAVDERESLESQLAEIDGEIDEREARIEELSAREDDLQAQISALEDEASESESLRDSELLDRYERRSELEYERGQLEEKLNSLESEIEAIEALDDEREELETEREQLREELTSLRNRIENLERSAIDTFNDHMETVLDRLGYENVERVWIERKAAESGRGSRSDSTFTLHVVRSADDGAVYEDTVDHLSESEREVIGLVVALAGYLVHDVHESVPVMVLDSLEAIDADRIAALVEYFADYAPFLVVALLPEDAQALDDDYERVVMDEALA
ncbi:AAA domain-containing protein [Halomicrobium zhouii]|uniref:AAA domain-containing protein n=1 Tax=Halomicrobium zhouii TaxID=767519 RepID=A0A1I6M1X6_9EURY|nr:archaea-specific SMC-related protein [Halomicrobium zhouii]SFS09719.1 AAA domain-containing protein [Halomicrobium zhouii]